MSDRVRLRLIVVGYGKMGRALEVVAAARGHAVAARVDPAAPESFRTIGEALAHAHGAVALEFSAPDAAPANVRALLEAGVPVVSGTTGWNDRMPPVKSLAEERGVGFLWAPNFSLGVAAMFRIAEFAAELLGALDGFDPFVVEEHHAAKHDAPSGTAVRLAEILVARSPGKSRFGPVPADGPITPGQIPVASVRAGSIPGSHRVGFDGASETLELVHRVRDRAVFAQGAVLAAEWLASRRGPATIEQMIDDLLARRRGG